MMKTLVMKLWPSFKTKKANLLFEFTSSGKGLKKALKEKRVQEKSNVCKLKNRQLDEQFAS